MPRITVDLDKLRRVVDLLHTMAESPHEMASPDLDCLCRAMELTDELIGGTDSEPTAGGK
jgi:hypothetical protein